MRLSFRNAGSAAALLGACCAACQTPTAPRSGSDAEPLPRGLPDETPAVAGELAPDVPVASDSVETVWDYLAARYDADRDGVVSAGEYDRDRDAFGRLDANRDGQIDPADFAAASPEAMQGRMRGLRAQMAVGRLFQADDDPDVLEAGELDWRITELDSNGDDSLSRAEIEVAAEELPLVEEGDAGFRAQFLAGRSAWEHLAPVDANGDGSLAREELMAYFEARDDGDGVWEVGGGGTGAGNRAAVAASGPPEGEWAPDFVLQPPQGGETVRLSDFRGERPVALVFGSYT